MARRALVLGSQIEGLRGVDNDCHRMAELLDASDFTVDLRTGEAAAREGMLAGYDRLIAASAPEDAAVVYYCGHGYYARVAAEGTAWQCIAPTDLRAGTATDWRGITAWELSIKQKELTDRTKNVTVILDCCHSAQLSRSDGVEGSVPRALPHPVEGGFGRHLEALRVKYPRAADAVDAVGNPDAVRVVACGQTECAFEYPDEAGQYHGAFTEVLIDVLTQVGTAQVSWAAIIGVIRARVLRRFVRQRPDVEGPARRGVFSLSEQRDLHTVAVAAECGGYRLSVGQLTGAAVGDVYMVLPSRSVRPDDSPGLARLEVVEVAPTTAIGRRIDRTDEPRRSSGAIIPSKDVREIEELAAEGGALPPTAVAVRVRRAARRWTVAVDASGAARAHVEEAIAGSSSFRTAQPRELGAVATVRVEGDVVTVGDGGGALCPPLRFPSELPRALTQVASLGAAQDLRELEGEHGVDAAEVAITLGAVRDGQRHPLPDHGFVFALGDRYYVDIRNRGQRTLFVHLLGINARGKITLLTHFAHRGVALDVHARSVTIGQRADGALVGVGLRWPEGLPAQGLPRLTELVVVATRDQVDISVLETEVAILRGGGGEVTSAPDVLCNRRYRSPGALDGFFLKRLSILLAPDAGAEEALAREGAQ